MTVKPRPRGAPSKEEALRLTQRMPALHRPHALRDMDVLRVSPMKRRLALVLLPVLSSLACVSPDSEPGVEVGDTEQAATTPLRQKALGRMRNAATYFHD